MAQPLQPLLQRWRDDLFADPPGRIVVPPSARAFVLAGALASGEGPLLVVVPGEREAEDLTADIGLFAPAILLPAWETLPFEHVSPNVATMAQRSRARHLLATGQPMAVVASVRAATQRLSPSPPEPVVVAAGDDVDRDEVIAALASRGYHRTDRVEARGELAVRGAIVDVFPAQGDQPVRIEWWGDDVTEIRRFSPSSQRSAGAIDRAVAYPAREFRPDDEVRRDADGLVAVEPWAAETWERMANGVTFAGIESWLPWLAPERTIFDEVAPGTRISIVDPVRARDRSRELLKEEAELAAALAPTWGHGAPQAGDHPELYMDIERALGDRPVTEVPGTASGPEEDSVQVGSLHANPGDAESVAGGLTRLLADDTVVVVAMDGEAAADRVQRVLGEHGLALDRAGALDSVRSAIVDIGIHKGFVLPEEGVAVLGEQEIAGRRRSHRAPGRRRRTAGDSYRDLRPGDFVVHHQHGIGRFEGLVTQTIAGVERDYLIVEYAGGDRLYVPTDQLAAVRKYSGGEAPRLSRMGGADWSSTRSRVRRELEAVAERVVELHRRRALASRPPYPEDSAFQTEFEASFPFEETPDQLTAIADVKADLGSGNPMDRLVFGDVGFGKTEVAMRAAFKVVEAGRQVAVLVPTTLLASQHHETFGERFAPFPMTVEMLSRFLSTREQREVVSRIATGEVDIVIGTHRMLSEDVKWKDLGLLIIDEEQRFGVAAKDAIKSLRSAVDVLTLTATPIPRTLEMALAGIRPVSHIRTPPEDRHPILTYVGPYDSPAVSAAIRRELLREGQVFYVHNRVQSIDRAVARLRELVPDARFAVAHGQMSEGQLEQVMLDFWEGRHDVLVATTIIESGLDLPAVNTLIVERAERLGLAQLYQLRGRVGRSSQRAYAYLFHAPDEHLSEEAYRRLEAIGEHTDLGAGFDLALRDLQIRGAGSILGEIQSGHISAVGLDLYSELVAEAVAELEGAQPAVEEPKSIRIDLPVDAHLPDDYIGDGEARLEAYRRLAVADGEDQLADVGAEWEDRYGPMPEEAVRLIDLARLRVEALRVGIEDVVKLRHEVRLSPVDLSPSRQVRLQRVSPRAVVRGKELFIPAPQGDIVASLLDFLRTMWPPEDP